VSFRSQQDFRRQLISALIAKSRASEVCPKRGISYISQGAGDVPPSTYEQVKLGKRGRCMNCRGLRLTDRPKKRVALARIASNQGRESTRHDTFYGCKQCDVYLCKNRSCFDVFHK
jgi:hypothetical protein